MKNTKRLVTDGLCTAIYVVLSSFLSLNLGPIKLSFSGLPIVLTGLLFGPADGLIVGLMGGFLGQLLGPYGVSVTTPLWMLPVGAIGLIVGWYAKRRDYELSVPQLAAVTLLALIADTTITTGAMYVDCLVFHYSFAIYAPYIVWRYVADVIKTALYALVLPALARALRKELTL